MKVTNGEIWDSQVALGQLVREKLPVRVSYELKVLTKKVNDQWRLLNELRNQLIERHGEKDKKSGQMMVRDGTPAMEAFNKEWNELRAIEVEVDVKPVKLPEMVSSTCDKCHHNMDRPFEIPAAVLLALDKFVEV